MSPETYRDVVGLTDTTYMRPPILGKIRLGRRVPYVSGAAKKCNCNHDKAQYCYKCARPTETDYFVCPKEVVAVHGKEPKELPVILLYESPSDSFPVYYVEYGATTGQKCVGNGEQADERVGSREWKKVKCPCAKLKDDKNTRGACTLTGSLLVCLYDVNLAGLYQIDTGSYHSIMEVRANMEYCREKVYNGEISMKPLVLERVPRITHEGSTSTHYTLRLRPPSLSLAELNALRAKQDSIYLPGHPIALPALLEKPAENGAGDRDYEAEGWTDAEARSCEPCPHFIPKPEGAQERATSPQAGVEAGLKAEVREHRDKPSGEAVADPPLKRFAIAVRASRHKSEQLEVVMQKMYSVNLLRDLPPDQLEEFTVMIETDSPDLAALINPKGGTLFEGGE